MKVLVRYSATTVLLLLLLIVGGFFFTICSSKKSLIVNIDNRPLTENVNDNSYASMSAVINLAYAKKHGYDFVYVQPLVDDLVISAHKHFGEFEDHIPPTNIAKDVATAFHVGLKQFRAASWAKLPPLWHLTTTFGDKYDYIWYIDSDAVVSPLHINRSIEAAVEEWETHYMVERGNAAVSKSAFIFFNNRPWRDDMPCAGSFIYRPKLAEPVLREWWDFDLPSKNFKHFHEQDALWHMMLAEKDDASWSKQRERGVTFRMNSSTYTISREQQFPSAWKRYEELWLCHIASYNYIIRNPILFHFLKVLDLESEASFAAAIQEVKAKHILQLRLLDITIAMEDTSKKEAAAGFPRITQFPAHEEATQSAFYDAHVTTKDLPSLPLSVLHEGHLIRRRGEFWLVINGTRHGFENFDTFLSMGFHKELGFPLNTAEVSSIPAGPNIAPTTKQGYLDQLPLWKLRDPYRPTSSGGSAFRNAATTSSTSTSTSRSDRSRTDGSGDCAGKFVVDTELEELVRTKGTRSVLYLISHDDDSEAMARTFARCSSSSSSGSSGNNRKDEEEQSWIKVVRLNGTVFFESGMYRDILPQRTNEWLGEPLLRSGGGEGGEGGAAGGGPVDFVITATYKTVGKQLHYNKFTQDLAMIKELLKAARDGDWDIVPFLRSGSGNMSFSSYWHGKAFRLAWDALLKAMGFSNDVIRSLDESKPFYRNIFIIKPAALKLLVSEMSRGMEIALQNKEVAELLSHDSKYKEGSVEVAQRMFGTNYYQLHPFIFERLPNFLLQVNGFKICHYSEDGPCKYNT